MAFQMIHMEVAYELIERLGIEAGKEEFLLGSVAPDAVHFREDYSIDAKIHSHLFEECGPWSDTQDYERWDSNIHDFWDRYGANEKDICKKMFVLGYCVHCITDYWNDLIIWRALQKEYIPPMKLEEFRAEYYHEAQTMDKWLFQNSKHTAEICRLLTAAKEIDIDDYVHSEDLVKIKHHLMDVQYNLPSAIDVTGYKYYPSSKCLWFVDTVAERIGKKFETYDNFFCC